MKTEPRIGILVVAYNAVATLSKVLDRIPVSFRAQVSEIVVADDHSSDDTYLVGLGYQQTSRDLPLTVVRHPRNLGYGGNQKSGYRLAIEHGLDIIVLLHGDGQYAPELLPEMIRPLVDDEADAVFGSRMLLKGAARDGGMPLYKFVGNRTLSTIQNALLGTSLSEFHSGYRAYTTAALKRIDFESNSDGFDFDTEIILQLHDAGLRIAEIPIPTYYGDEICYVNGMKYARDVLKHSLEYRLRVAGFNTGVGRLTGEYPMKSAPNSSHGRILSWTAGRPSSKVLDIGCADGALGGEMRDQGHYVVGVDVNRSARADDNLDEVIYADLDQGLPADISGDFDLIICADVLEHLRQPDVMLGSLHPFLGTGGRVIVSIPNFAHWYPRVKVATGRFDYDRRGILDVGHLRFFTDRTFRRLVSEQGFKVVRREAVGLPFEAVIGDGHGGSETSARFSGRAARLADQLSVNVYPTLFAYQYVYELAAGTR